MIRILGLDPGLADTGYGIIEINHERITHITHGSITTEPTCTTGERLGEIQRAVVEVILRFGPVEAGIESLYFARNITSAIPVAQARGVLLLTLAQQGIPAREFAPLEIKMAITGSGRASKQQVQELVRLLVGLPEVPEPDHAADALAAAICCFHTRFARERIERGGHV